MVKKPNYFKFTSKVPDWFLFDNGIQEHPGKKMLPNYSSAGACVGLPPVSLPLSVSVPLSLCVSWSLFAHVSPRLSDSVFAFLKFLIKHLFGFKFFNFT